MKPTHAVHCHTETRYKYHTHLKRQDRLNYRDYPNLQAKGHFYCNQKQIPSAVFFICLHFRL